jgi:hypothetical protein
MFPLVSTSFKIVLGAKLAAWCHLDPNDQSEVLGGYLD